MLCFVLFCFVLFVALYLMLKEMGCSVVSLSESRVLSGLG